jgi:hypothetical protein
MSGKRGTGYRYGKVPVPSELRKEFTAMLDRRVGRNTICRDLKISMDVLLELIHPAGILQQKTIDRISASLASRKASAP